MDNEQLYGLEMFSTYYNAWTRLKLKDGKISGSQDECDEAQKIRKRTYKTDQQYRIVRVLNLNENASNPDNTIPLPISGNKFPNPDRDLFSD